MTAASPTTLTATPSAGGRPGVRAALVVLLVATVATAFVPRDLWSPDEQRYGQVPREILRSGDWVVLHLNERPYAEKPPLFFWSVAAVSAPFGDVDAFRARLVGCLYAAGAFLALFLLVRRWFGDEATALTATLIFATNLLVLYNATRATQDLALTCFVLLAAERGSAWLRHGGAGRALLFGAAWAAGVLTKGPLGLLLPALSVAGEAALLRSRPGRRDPGWWLAPVFMAALCLAWAVPAVREGGEVYRARLLGQVVSRTSGAEGHQVNSPLWFLGVLVGAGLPWTFHLLAGLRRAAWPWAAPAEDRAGLAACLGGGVVGLLVLFLVATKREVYLIPPLPFLAAAGAWALHRGLDRVVLRIGTVLVVGAPLAGAGLAVAAAFTGDRFLIARQPWPDQVFDASRFVALLPAAVVFAIGFAWAFRVRLGEKGVLAARRAGLALAVGALLLKAGLFPEIDARKSFARLADAANAAAGAAEIAAAGPIQDDLLWNLRRTHVTRIRDFRELVRTLDPDPGTPEKAHGAAVVESRWWNARREALAQKAHADADADAAAWVRRADRLHVSARVPAEHRTYLVLTPPEER